MLESIIAAIIAFTSPVATTADTTFAEDVRACAERDTYEKSRSCIENIWKDRDATMPHCADDDVASNNCIWEGSSRTNNGRYIDVDGIAYYIRMDHITMNV